MNGATAAAESQAARAVSGVMRPIRQEDNASVAALIRAVLTEFGGNREGTAIHDPEVDSMFETYAKSRSAYFVIERGGVIVGGGGIAPLKGGSPKICELQKFYILPAQRGHGYGRLLLDKSLAAAKAHGFAQCYIETFATMDKAASLYKRAGFAPISAPMGATGHTACDRWYVKEL